MRKSINWTPIKWISFGRIRTDRFREILSRDTSKEIFDDKFFDAIAERKKDQEKLARRLFAIQFIILGFLGLSLYQINVTFNFFGLLSVKADQLREILIFVGASITAFQTLQSSDTEQLDEIIAARIDQQSGGHKNTKEFLSLRYSDFWGRIPASARSDDKYVFETWAPLFVYLVTGFMALFLIFAFVGLGLAIHIAVLIDVVQRPTFSKSFSWFIVLYDVAAALFGLSIYFLLKGPLPYRDFRRTVALGNLKKNNPAKYEKVIKNFLNEQAKRNWLVRVLKRPKPPEL